MSQQQNLPQEYIANHSKFYDTNTFTIVNQERRVTLPPQSSSSSSKNTVVLQHVDATYQKDPAPSLQQISRYTDIVLPHQPLKLMHHRCNHYLGIQISIPAHPFQVEAIFQYCIYGRRKKEDRHHLGSATATASMDYYCTKTSTLSHQRYNHHFQFFLVWILLPIMVVLVVVATTMRVMVVVRATPFPDVMLDLGNAAKTCTCPVFHKVNSRLGMTFTE
jgi:hypothetical protein